MKTAMDKWCEKNGYDKNGVFVYTSDESGCWNKGDVIKLSYDDDSNYPYFSQNGINHPAALEFLTQRKQQFPTTPFKLSCGDKPEVRQWLKDNGCIVWDSIMPNKKYLFIDNTMKVYWDCESYYNSREYKEITPIITPDKVVGVSCGEDDKVERKRKKIEKKIAKLQVELERLGNK